MAALALEGQHALSPCLAGELVGFPACFNRALGRYAEGGAVKPVAEAAAAPGINVSQFPHSE